MKESESLRYMMETEGWKIVKRELENKIQYSKDRLMNCPLEEVELNRSLIKELNGFFSRLEEIAE